MQMTYGLPGEEKPGFFWIPGSVYDLLDPMVGDEVGGFPGGRSLRREGSHPMTVLCYPELLKVAETGEFRHTVLGNHHFWVI
ncbi:MAG: hypothetical protein STSR0009_19200 [Methanoregula sp.]